MTEDNVVPMPTMLGRLAILIQSDIARREFGREEWIEGTLALCEHLAEARDAIPANIDFSRWCSDNGFGEDVLNYNDRAAAIAMGKNIAQARTVLEATERKSLRHIHANEFDLHHVVKTKTDDQPQPKEPTVDAPQAEPQAAAPKPKPKPAKVEKTERIGDKEEHTLAVFDRMRLAGKVINRRTLAIEAGVSFGTAQRAYNRRLSEEKAAAALAEPLKPTKTNEEAVEREVRKRVQEARAIFEKEIKDDINKRLHEDVLPGLNQKDEWARRIIAGAKGVFTKAEYRTIQKCLHPDRAKAISEAELGEAFRIFTAKEDVLKKPDGPPPASSLPKTVDELMAMRRAKEERRKK